MASNGASTNILRVRESRSAVWNTGTGQWDPMVQPILNAGSVTIPGTVTVIDGGGSLTVDAVNLDIRDLSSATDSIAVTDGGSSITVDGTVGVSGTVAISAAALPLPSDAATQTTLAALNAKVTAVNTGAVVVSSSALPSGAATAAAQLPDGHNVTIDNASGGAAVNIQDGGNSITVDGTVAVSGSVAVTGPLTDTQLRASAVPVSLTSTTVTGSVAVTDNAGSLTVDAPVATPVFVRLSDGAAAIATLPVSLASIPALVASSANIGDVDVLTLPSIPAGTNNIGDVDVLTLPAITGTVTANAGTNLNTSALALDASITTLNTSVNNLLKPANTLTAVTTVSTVTNLAGLTTAYGKTLTYVPVAQGAAGTTVLAAANGSAKHKIISCVLTLSAAGTLKFLDGVGDLTGAMDIAASGGFVLPASLLPYQQTATNSALSITTTGGAAKGVVTILTEA